MKTNSLILYLLIFSFIIICCENPVNDCEGISYPENTDDQVTISQGVWGNVWFWQGDFQPICPHGKVFPVEREIHIYEATPADSVEYSTPRPFISNVKTKLIKIVKSNSTGFFEVTLDSGAYSFFVKEDSLLYANGGDNNFLQPGYVATNSKSKIQIDINYKASY